MHELDNSIFIGEKPFMNYVTGIIMQFTMKEASEVIVKARGKYIGRAIDVSLSAVKEFLQGKVAIADVLIDAEEIENKEGRRVRVSVIEILLKRA